MTNAPIQKTADDNPDQVALHEVRPMREQVRAAVCARIAGVPMRPISEVRMPEFAIAIVVNLIAEFCAEYPNGLPSHPQDIPVIAHYGNEAIRRFNAELAKQFDLKPIEEQSNNL